MDEMRCVCVGYGTVARIHEAKLHSLGVRTGAVVDRQAQKRQQAAADGYLACGSCAEASLCHPDLWDICVDTNQPVKVL